MGGMAFGAFAISSHCIGIDNGGFVFGLPHQRGQYIVTWDAVPRRRHASHRCDTYTVLKAKILQLDNKSPPMGSKPVVPTNGFKGLGDSAWPFLDLGTYFNNSITLSKSRICSLT